MRVRRLVPVAAVAVGGWVAWGLYWGDFRGPVTDAEARNHFGRIVAAAQSKDFDALCRLNSSMGTCRAELQHYCPETYGSGPAPIFPSGEELERVCRESVPPEPPVIVSSRDQTRVRAGRVLTVRGIDGRGKPYETEVLVFWTGRGFLATHAVFWSNDKFEELREAGR